MNRYILCLLFIVTGSFARSQCLTSSLVISTGYNPITGAAIAGGANGAAAVPDPHWIVYAISPATSAAIAATPGGAVAVVPGNSADVVTPITGSWVANPAGNPGNWINCENSNTYNDQGTGLTYSMTLGRPFKLCSSDSIKLTLHIASDNYLSAADIDGTPLAMTFPATGFNAYTALTQTVWLTSGTHTLHFVIVNQNLTALGSNPTGLNVYGTVASSTGINSLISESYAICSSYNCTSVCNTITLPDSLHLCQGGSDTLRATVTNTDSVLSMVWTPATGLSSNTVLRPLLTVGTTSGWYDLTVQSLIPFELVYNGDFSLGNTGFSTTYIYGGTGPNAIYQEGYYSVVTNPALVHPAAISFGDHTTGTGNMMAINGSGTPTSVWCQTIPVTPNTTYAFSAWAANWSTASTGANSPILQFEIDGVLIGSAFTISSAPGVWIHFYATWNSGSSTTANICIYDACTALNGNDFALDDISFKQICVTQDSIYVDVQRIDTTYNHVDTSACPASPTVVLAAPAGYNPYLWNTGSSSSSISVGTPGSYWVYAASHCAMLIDTFHYAFRPVPVPPVGRDTSYCLGYGSPVPLNMMVSSVPGSLTWYESGVAQSGTPSINTGAVTYPGGTTYYVTQTVNGCQSDSGSVNVQIVPPPAISISARPWVCQFDSISLAYTGPALIRGGFLWSIPPGSSFANGTNFSDSLICVKFDAPNNNTVLLTANNLYGQCPNSDSVIIQVVQLPTASASTKSDVCLSDTVSLALSERSANAIDFTWYVDNAPLLSSNALNIVASSSDNGGPYVINWADTGMHVIQVQAFAEHSCTNKPTSDSVYVHPSPDATFRITTLGGPLCLEDSVLFSANDSGYQNMYNWSPAHFFTGTNKYAEWGRVQLEQSIVTLNVTDPFGCVGTSSRELDPSVCCNIPFPNAFTPNGDGKNDVFRPVPQRAYHTYHTFRIQNRWGQTVFESTDNKASWDGTFNGVPQDMGVYFYYLKYDCDGKTMEQKGDVTLIR